jgi:hypothetical protein
MQCTETPQAILQGLRDHGSYLSGHPLWKRAPCFEWLVAQAFANSLHVPVFDSEHDDPNVHPRVTWLGKCSDMTPAPQGAPDAIVRAHEFFVLVEPTLKTGSKQWSQEFGPCVDHYEQFASDEQVSEGDVYIALVTSQLHEHTYNSICHAPIKANFVLLELPDLTTVLETIMLAPYAKHAHLRKLFNGVLKDLQKSSCLTDFRSRKQARVAEWQKDVLNNEKSIFLGIKAYQAIRQMGKRAAAEVDILGILQQDAAVQRYEELVGKLFTLDDIGNSLVSQNLASCVSEELYQDRFISVIPVPDYKATANRIQRALEEING